MNFSRRLSENSKFSNGLICLANSHSDTSSDPESVLPTIRNVIENVYSRTIF